MADAIYAGVRARHKTNPILEAGLSPANHLETVHPGIVGSALRPDEQIAVLALLDQQGGEAPVSDCIAALPDHPRPATALIALADAGIVAFDRDAAFDANCVVRRVGPARS